MTEAFAVEPRIKKSQFIGFCVYAVAVWNVGEFLSLISILNDVHKCSVRLTGASYRAQKNLDLEFTDIRSGFWGFNAQPVLV